LDRKDEQWVHYYHDPDIAGSLSHDLVRAVYVDHSGTLWVGSRGGLDRYDPEKDGFIHYEAPETMWIHEGTSGTLWFATRGGLFQLDRDTDQLIFLKEAASWMIMVLEDRSGLVWVGTSGDGLYRYDPTNGEWRHFWHDPDDPNSLSENSVEAIHEDDAGILWLATHGGLDRFDWQTETFTHYRVQDGLANEYVTGLMQDRQGNLWLGTNGGLSRFDPATETFKNYYASDGLLNNLFWRNSYYQSDDGEMFFGGQDGLDVFYPEQISDNPHPPPVVITAFGLFNQVVRTNLRTDERIELDYQDNFLSFDFAALDYHNPEKNQYAYQMEGVDEDWVFAGNRRHADYPDLPPGDYTFRVIASNNDGVWNEAGVSLAITIQPPFWETPWFIGLVIAALIGAGYGAYRYRVRSLRERSLQLEKEVAERTTELQSANTQLEREIAERERAEQALAEKAAEAAVAEERNRLARELHDAVTQTLFSASLLAEALPNSWENDPEEGRQLLAEIRQLSRGALAEMRTLLHELRPTTIVETAMRELLRQLGEAVTGRAGIPVYVQVECQCGLPPDVHVATYRIAQESLNNIVKHARASSVRIQFICSRCAKDFVTILIARRVILTIEDDGRGFDPQQIASEGMGLAIMRERAESVGAELQITSQPGEGARIELVWDDMEIENDG
jgi:signal transduction histidine kinase/streptogramin lyase